jgi:hypothetical protein
MRIAAVTMFLALPPLRAAAQVEPVDLNCDGEITVADVAAAPLLSADPEALADCAAGDPYRGADLSDEDLSLLSGNVFFAFETPWTPTPTPTPTVTRTPTSTRTRTATPSTTSTPLPTLTFTFTFTPTATDTPLPTETPLPTSTRTATETRPPTSTRTPTPTRTVTVTRTPTGLAYRLSGEWAANWQNRVCFLAGVPFASLQDTVYVVTAVNGFLDIDIKGGQQIARGLTIGPNGNVAFRYTAFDSFCPTGGQPRNFVFDYVFTFQLNGTGSAEAEWTFGRNTFCASCQVSDSAGLVKIAGPS